MVLAALEAGKHVLCEKPMARSVAEARDMTKMAEQVGVAAMVHHEFPKLLLPIRRRIKELIDQGFLGEPQSATLTVFRSSLADPYGRPFSWLYGGRQGWRTPGPTGSHHIDALRWWFGEIKGVAGATATMVGRRWMPDGSIMAKVDADDNFAVSRSASPTALWPRFMSARPRRSIPAKRSSCPARPGCSMAHGDDALYGARWGEAALQEQDIPARPDDDLPNFGHPLIPPTIGLHRAWIRAIREGTQATPSFNDGAKVQEVIDGVHRSSRQGRWVDTSGTRWPVART